MTRQRALPRWLQRISLCTAADRQDGAGSAVDLQQHMHSKDSASSFSTPPRPSCPAQTNSLSAFIITGEQSKVSLTAMSPFPLAPWDEDSVIAGSLPACTAVNQMHPAPPLTAPIPQRDTQLSSPISDPEKPAALLPSSLRPTAPEFSAKVGVPSDVISRAAPPLHLSDSVSLSAASQPSCYLSASPSSPLPSVSGRADTTTGPEALTSSSLEGILASFSTSFLANLDRIVLSLQSSVKAVEERVLLSEIKLRELITSHNSLAAVCRQLEEESRRLANKSTCQEDYNRRNNLKLRGIPEHIPPPDLTPYIQKLIKTVVPAFSNRDLVIDWVRRVPRPKHLSQNTPRDVVVRIHFHHVKSAFFSTTRRLAALPDDYHDISVFSDLSPGTLRWRKSFAEVTKVLRKNGILYRWNNSVHVTILKGDTKHIVTSPEEGMKLLQAWNLR